MKQIQRVLFVCKSRIRPVNVVRSPSIQTIRSSSSQPSAHQWRSRLGFGLAGAVIGVVGTALALSRGSLAGSKLSNGSEVVEDNPQLHLPSKYADNQTMQTALREIQEALGEGTVSIDEDDLETHGYSEWSTSNTTARPMAVITPRSTDDVSTIAKICNRYRVPLIAYGAGSSVEGHISAPFSGFSIDMSGMNDILVFHEDDMDVVVQPGVNWVDLNEKLKPSGLFLPLDPSPTAHIGGMVATNCSGTNAMRYGTMKDWVLNLTVVLADGTIIKTRRRPRKTSAGYNLTALFTGSEGTLGIITEITLKLAVIPPASAVATVSFPTVRDAAAAASKMMRQGLSLGALELMDDEQMRIVNQAGGTGKKSWKELPTLFLKFSGTKDVISDSISSVRAIARNFKGEGLEVVTTEQEMQDLWSARKLALWSMLAVRPEGTQMWGTDVAVPLSRMAEIIESSKQNSSKLGLFSSVLGHVGDGNFHQTVMYNPNEPEQVEAVKECVDEMILEALEMEGTVSGEHGIGLGKKHCLMKELGPVTVGVMKALKTTLDPHWILNPGKVFDE
ncbi:uncharacterized protein Z520_02828 [Fonsecaea multimorphosa CBS 102226]|uniref:D-lactate dehydrogenase (cytochrome) n=1 Tax=Fonsecaea multimorphosa CBS 102226 TaxID=1442371 RepID=A0A0D2HH80_9EURO|nr:uncharacterized protein Z520_02828 [Fonsecaea multimorphosa CBS 102226]KIY01276.1 hypothetical protein Z520_02828 [Fonsecaea multimorphosa CBS 102226]OAL28554.1 hypothetical protein AYO22_02748 [Fonsecaea multimorphosa]